MSATWDNVQSFFTNGAADWATSLAVVSQLPGRIDGPADAYRHLLISAELYRTFPDAGAEVLLRGHEQDWGWSSDSDMDNYNNDVGAKIGQYVASQDGSTQDVIDLVNAVMSKSLPAGSALGGTSLVLPDRRVQLVPVAVALGGAKE